ncbi:chromatin assembly factor 1 subunit A [Microcaecilia unicolor]|uniref:Chromatin assembly factor 1 subunit A n=1 Tax=Microcaecilia unicolor TaxID=1415580 RepID=A0A6P7ZC71_9AMPH|nr:chromatin assembly factor 1 subunit A [Microcaecilia unicolor]
MPGLGLPSGVRGTQDSMQKSPAVMHCKDKSAIPGKRLVQARLPFKRLNPVPKKTDESLDVKKAKIGSETTFVHNKLPNLNTSVDDVENDCQVHIEVAPPVLQTGKEKGPLDHFIKKTGNISVCVPLTTVDLTEDSNSGLFDEACRKLNSEASSQTTNGPIYSDPYQLGSLEAGQNDNSDVPMETEVTDHTPKAKTVKPCASLMSKQEARSEVEKSKTDHSVKNVIFHMKMPVVVLEDIMALKPAQIPSVEGSMLETQVPEEVDSPPEDSSLVQSSSNSPFITDSLLDVQSAQNTNSISPSSATTPVRKLPEKINKCSTEKKKQREQEREDKRLKLKAEREEREKLKEEVKAAKERAKEEAKKKKDEEKGQKEREKKERKEKEEREKAEKLKLKEEKRKEKQEALEAKQEEKRKKEEEKRLKEEEKRIKAEKAEITRFFQKPQIPQVPKIFASFCGKFAPFEIKKNMALAPLCRVVFDQDAVEQCDRLIKDQSSDFSYLKDLKHQKPRKSCRTVVQHKNISPVDSGAISGEPDEVQILATAEVPLNSDLLLVGSSETDGLPERRRFGRMKLLQFCENYRPAYWGTWNRMSETICARNPWSKDNKLLDYEVDSDEEWEEEEPGESLSHSEGDEDDEAGEDEEDDDGFFVPHGYLSEDEGASEEEKTDPENQKVRQKLKAKEWDELLSKGKKFQVLQPVVIGCIWEGAGAGVELKVLQRFAVCFLESNIAEEELVQETTAKRTSKDQQILAQLLPLLHGNINSSKVIIQEFQEYCRRGLLTDRAVTASSNGASPTSSNTSRPQTPTTNEENTIPSKARLKRIISENSVYEKRPDYRMCWYVHAEVLRSFDQENLPFPCQWTYLTQVKDDSNTATGGQPQTTPVSVKRKPTGSMSITKFMKRPKKAQQAEAVEADGFQADTEEDEEEDPDCMVVNVQPVS